VRSVAHDYDAAATDLAAAVTGTLAAGSVAAPRELEFAGWVLGCLPLGAPAAGAALVAAKACRLALAARDRGPRGGTSTEGVVAAAGLAAALARSAAAWAVMTEGEGPFRGAVAALSAVRAAPRAAASRVRVHTTHKLTHMYLVIR
jgi:hypothetical protein